MIFACQAYESKCIKCNSPHKVEYHREIVWCCKVNFKTNFLNLKLKKANSIHIDSSTLIARGNIKPIATLAHFGNIISTKNSMPRSIKSSEKKRTN